MRCGLIGLCRQERLQCSSSYLLCRSNVAGCIVQSFHGRAGLILARTGHTVSICAGSSSCYRLRFANGQTSTRVLARWHGPPPAVRVWKTGRIITKEVPAAWMAAIRARNRRYPMTSRSSLACNVYPPTHLIPSYRRPESAMINNEGPSKDGKKWHPAISKSMLIGRLRGTLQGLACWGKPSASGAPTPDDVEGHLGRRPLQSRMRSPFTSHPGSISRSTGGFSCA